MQSQADSAPDLELRQKVPIFRRNSENKGKGLDQILQRIRRNSEDAHKSQTKILKIRRRKMQNDQRIAYYKDLELESMKPGVAVLRTFSQSKPLNTGDPFLDEKKKAKLLFSQRAYTKMPNIMSGVYQKRVETETQMQKCEWISRKFSQYDKTVTQQTGPLRILTKKREQIQSGYEKKKSIYASKLKNTANLFSNYETSKIDFFDDAKKTVSTTHGFSVGLKTQGSLLQDSLSSKKLLKDKMKKIKSQVKETLRQGWGKRTYTDFD